MKQLSMGQKIIAAVLALVMLGVSLSAYFGLPAQVNRNTGDIRDLTRMQERHERDFREHQRINDRRWERVLCHLEEQRSTTPMWERCEG